MNSPIASRPLRALLLPLLSEFFCCTSTMSRKRAHFCFQSRLFPVFIHAHRTYFHLSLYTGGTTSALASDMMGHLHFLSF